MRLAKNILISILSFILSVSLLSFIYALLINNQVMKADIDDVKIGTLIIAIISYFILGFISGALSKTKGIITGFVYGLGLLAIMYLLSRFNILRFNLTSFPKMMIYLLTTMIGGILGRNLVKKRNPDK